MSRAAWGVAGWGLGRPRRRGIRFAVAREPAVDPMTKRNPAPTAASDAVAAYIAAAPEPARRRLRALRAAVQKEAPHAVERIAYGLPTWHQGENLIHLGGFAEHVGVYPGPAAIRAFARELESFATSKGAIRIPHDRELPLDLVRRIVRWRIAEASKKRAAPKPARKASRR